MIPFETSAEQRVELYKILGEMSTAGLSAEFVVAVEEIAKEYQGAYELCHLWKEEADQKERDEIIADLQEEIDSRIEARTKPYCAPKINFDELDRNIENVRMFKTQLRELVDRWGGISKLAKATGMPQPSLSRFFASSSFPRNTTIYRIVDALQSGGNVSWRPPFAVDQIAKSIALDKSDSVDESNCDDERRAV